MEEEDDLDLDMSSYSMTGSSLANESMISIDGWIRQPKHIFSQTQMLRSRLFDGSTLDHSTYLARIFVSLKFNQFIIQNNWIVKNSHGSNTPNLEEEFEEWLVKKYIEK